MQTLLDAAYHGLVYGLGGEQELILRLPVYGLSWLP